MNLPGSDRITVILDAVLAEESDTFTNSPTDSGGPTKWGITQATLSDHLGRPAKILDVQRITREDAFQILHVRYVVRPHFAEVCDISQLIGTRLIDGGVISGPAILSIFLQRCLNALNLNATRYPDIPVNGEVSPSTLAALKSYLAWRGTDGERVLAEAIECLLGARFITDAERRPKDEAYLYGWLKNRITL